MHKSVYAGNYVSPVADIPCLLEELISNKSDVALTKFNEMLLSFHKAHQKAKQSL
jgi:hypothetical protein